MARADRWSSGIVTAILTGAMYALSRDIGPVGPLALLAPVPLLWFAFQSREASRVGVIALLAFLISSSSLFYAYAGTIPSGVLALALLPLAIQFTFVILATRWAVARLLTWAGVFAFPLLMTASEFVLLMFAPNGSFGALGYSLVELLPLAQVASLGGVAALTFVTGLIPSTIALALHRHSHWRTAAIAGAAPLLAILLFGAWRLAQPYERSTRVALASIDELTLQALKGPEEAHRVAERYATLVRSLAGQRIEAVVLPERVFADRESQISPGSELLQAAAKAVDAQVVAGFDEELSYARHANTARIFLPEGSMHRYTKRRLIPGVESHLVAGNAPFFLGDRAVAICKDLDFAPMIREYGQQGTRLLLAPAWDFKIDGRLHARMAVIRGIENGFALARAAAVGRLTVSDAFGRIVAEKTTSDREPVMLIADVGLVSSPTVYTRVGDLFGWLCVLAAGLTLAAAARRHAGSPSTHSERAAQNGSEAI